MKPFWLVLSTLGYSLIAYGIDRSQFAELILSVLVLYIAYSQLVKTNVSVLWAIFFRLIFIVSTPALSDDFWRFIFDGQLVSHSINPYAFTPDQFSLRPEYTQVFAQGFPISKLNSPHYYSVYTPVNQAIFAICSILSCQTVQGNVIGLHLVIIIAEVGTIFLIKKGFGEAKALLYAFNPFIIIELTGNIHFEALQILGLAFALYFLQNPIKNALGLAFAINLKLNPALLVPFLISKKKILGAGIITFLSLVIFFVSLTGSDWQHFGSSLRLYFKSFQFNGSILYLLKWLGLEWRGYDVLAEWSWATSFLTIAGIMWMYFKMPYLNQLQKACLAFSFYLFLSPVVHPWYVATPLFLGILGSFWFVWVWAGTVFLSYHAYGVSAFSEKPLLLIIEYIPVFIVLGLELFVAFRNFRRCNNVA